MDEMQRQKVLMGIIHDVAKAGASVNNISFNFDCDALSNIIMASILVDYTPRQFFFPLNNEEKNLFRDYVRALYHLDFDIHEQFVGMPRRMLQSDVVSCVMGESPEQFVSILQSSNVMESIYSFSMCAVQSFSNVITEKKDFTIDGHVYKFWSRSITSSNGEFIRDIRYSKPHKDCDEYHDPILVRYIDNQFTQLYFPSNRVHAFQGLAAIAALEKLGFGGRLCALAALEEMALTNDVAVPLGVIPPNSWQYDLIQSSTPYFNLKRLRHLNFYRAYVSNGGNIPLRAISRNNPEPQREQPFNMWDCI